LTGHKAVVVNATRRTSENPAIRRQYENLRELQLKYLITYLIARLFYEPWSFDPTVVERSGTDERYQRNQNLQKDIGVNDDSGRRFLNYF
jgi:hypothetical protein